MVLTTDGVLEAHNKKGEMFGRDRLKKIIRRYADLGAEGIRLAIEAGAGEVTRVTSLASGPARSF